MKLYTILLCLYLVIYSTGAIAQSRYIDRHGHASFFSEAPLEDIEAHSTEAVSLIDVQKGIVVASVNMHSFQFEKSLMQEHFNEEYVESAKFPKATFKGKILNIDQLNLTHAGKYDAEISGDITIHGITKPLLVKAEFFVSKEAIKAKAKFPLKIAAFDIKIPKIVMYNIAEEVMVSLSFNYEPLNP